MEKQGIVKPGLTPADKPVDEKQAKAQSIDELASDNTASRILDKFEKRMSDLAEGDIDRTSRDSIRKYVK
jgi:hypothetical protein